MIELFLFLLTLIAGTTFIVSWLRYDETSLLILYLGVFCLACATLVAPDAVAYLGSKILSPAV